jgi:Icc-related predicted phosphoesterase
MRVLLVSDLHYTLKQLDWVSGVAADFDLVVIAGDHLDIASTVTVDAQVVVILRYLERLSARTRLLVCSGNHDLNGRNEAGEKMARWMARVRRLGIATDGDFVEVEGVSVSICPWWDGPHTRSAVAIQLERDAARRAHPWIWVYHAPPDESPTSWAGKRHFGDGDLVRWIRTYQPDMVLTGHIHQSPFRDGGSWVDRIGSTWVFNAGRQIGPVPTHVILDTDAQLATWLSLAGTATVPLDRPLEAASGAPR